MCIRRARQSRWLEEDVEMQTLLAAHGVEDLVDATLEAQVSGESIPDASGIANAVLGVEGGECEAPTPAHDGDAVSSYCALPSGSPVRLAEHGLGEVAGATTKSEEVLFSEAIADIGSDEDWDITLCQSAAPKVSQATGALLGAFIGTLGDTVEQYLPDKHPSVAPDDLYVPQTDRNICGLVYPSCWKVPYELQRASLARSTATFVHAVPVEIMYALRFAIMCQVLSISPSSIHLVLTWARAWFGLADAMRLGAGVLLVQVFTGVPGMVCTLLPTVLYACLQALGPMNVLCVVFACFIWQSLILRQVLLLVLERRIEDFDPAHLVVKGLGGQVRAAHSSDRESASHPTTSRLRNDAVEKILVIVSRFQRSPYFMLATRRIMEMVAENPLYGVAPTLYGPEYDLVNDAYAYETPPTPFGREIPEAIVLIDRDYYVDMTEVLMVGVPVVIYTLDPLKPCYRCEEYEYTFNGDDVLLGRVMGGKAWEHRLWDYPDDVVQVARRTVMRAYKVFRYRVSKDRSIIVFYPIASSICFRDHALKRRRFAFGGALLSVEGIDTHIGVCGGHETMTFDSAHWESMVADVRARSLMKSIPAVAHSQVDKYLRPLGEQVTDDHKRFVFNVLKVLDYPDLNVTLSTRVFSFDTSPRPPRVPGLSFIDDEGGGEPDDDTTAMVRAGHNMVEAGVAMERTPQNTSTAICTRVIGPQITADARTAVVDDKYFDGVEKFLNVLCQTPLEPCDEEEVARRMSRPPQRQDMDASSAQESPKDSRSVQFQKVEKYTNYNHPRNIVTQKGRQKFFVAQFTYPVADFLKTMPWYAFGRSCSEVAERVVEICARAQRTGRPIVKTDFIRFDGTVCAFARYFIMRVYARFYPDWDEDAVAAMASRYDEIVHTTDDQVYYSGYSQLSGDNNTSIMGTLLNAYCNFMALLECGMNEEEAFDALGLYGGDDGLSDPPEPEVLANTADALGLALDCVPIYPPDHDSGESATPESVEKYVDFLARVYGPGVWNGDADSCCDFVRTVSKFCDIDASAPHPAYRLYEKAYAASLNDANTPIFGPYVCAIADIGKTIMKDATPFKASSMEEFTIKYSRSVNWWGAAAVVHGSGFPNGNYGSWMDTYVAQALEKDPDHVDAGSYMEYLQTRIDAAYSLLRAEDLGRLIGKRVRLSALGRVLAPLLTLEPMARIDGVPKKDSVCLLTTADDSEQFVSGTNKSTPVPGGVQSPDIRVDLVARYAVYAPIIRGDLPPLFADFPPGARKCMYVAASFLDDICKRFGRSCGGCQVVYTGAYSPYTAVPIARLMNARLPRAFRFLFFDPAFNGRSRESKEVFEALRVIPKVQVRKIAVTGDEFEKVVANAKSKKTDAVNRVFWLDDAYAANVPNADAQYMSMKLAILSKFGEHLSLSSVKYKTLTADVTLPFASHRYHTPEHQLFSTVEETRLVVTNEKCITRHTPTDSVPMTDVSEAVYCLVNAELAINSLPEIPKGKEGDTQTILAISRLDKNRDKEKGKEEAPVTPPPLPPREQRFASIGGESSGSASPTGVAP